MTARAEKGDGGKSARVRWILLAAAIVALIVATRVLPVADWLRGFQSWVAHWGTAIVSLASTTAAALAFLIARYVARGRVEALAERNQKFRAIDHAIREKGWRVVALLRLSPLVPFSVSNYLYGLTPVSFGPYVLASWIAMLPATVLYVWIGAAGKAAAEAGGGHGRSPLEWALLGAGLLATAAVTVMITRTARRQLARRGV